MSDEDRRHWDERYREAANPATSVVAPVVPTDFVDHAHRFPDSGSALDVACGTGGGSLWLAERGLRVLGVDVSIVAIEAATATAAELGLSHRCRFMAADLDDGLPDTPPLDLVVCHRYLEPLLFGPMVERLVPGGMLAVAVLSEVGSAPGRYRAGPGQLRRAFADAVDVMVDVEGSGVAVLIGVKAQ